MHIPGLASMMILFFDPSGTNLSASIAAVSGLRTTDLWAEILSVGKYLRHIFKGGNSPVGTSGRTSPGRRTVPLPFLLRFCSLVGLEASPLSSTVFFDRLLFTGCPSAVDPEASTFCVEECRVLRVGSDKNL